MESRTLTRTLVGGVVAVALALGTRWVLGRGGKGAEGSAVVRVERVVPEGTRIRVEVLNATTVRGLARRATMYLRDAGFDVVRFAGDSGQRDSTLVLDRSAHPEWAALVGRVLGARVVSRPDSSRYVDVTVLLGSSWRAPPQPFYP